MVWSKFGFRSPGLGFHHLEYIYANSEREARKIMRERYNKKSLRGWEVWRESSKLKRVM